VDFLRSRRIALVGVNAGGPIRESISSLMGYADICLSFLMRGEPRATRLPHLDSDAT
jgi:hypothetical protein